MTVQLTPLCAQDVDDLLRAVPETDTSIGVLLTLPQNPSWAGREGGVLLGVGGILQDWDGVGRCWIILTPAGLARASVGMVLAMRRQLEHVVASTGYWRLAAQVDCQDAQAIKLVRVLGFRREGRAQRFFPDQRDAYHYAWIRGACSRRLRGRRHG